MGWAMLAIIAAAAAGVLGVIGIPRPLWAFIGAAMMLGAAGYAMQGSPRLAGHPVQSGAEPIMVDPDLIALRDAMVGRFRADTAYLVAADAMTRSGDTHNAVKAVLGGLQHYPDSFALWVGLGMTLATHDGAKVSPTAKFAFDRAARLAPLQPAPPFFLGLAHIRAGEFAMARPYWARAVALTPAGVSYRPALVERLALLDRLLTVARAMEAQDAQRHAQPSAP